MIREGSGRRQVPRLARGARRAPTSTPRGPWLSKLLIGLAVITVIATWTGLLGTGHATHPTGRGAIETAITMWALVASILLYKIFEHTRSRRDLMLLAALGVVSLTDFVFSVLPALAGSNALSAESGARYASELLVALAFIAAAFSQNRTISGRGRRPTVIAALTSLGVVLIGWLFDLTVQPRAAQGSRMDTGLSAAIHHPVSTGLAVLCSGVLLVAAVAFVIRARRGYIDGWLLATAAFLLSASRLQYLTLPDVAADWITPRDALRLGAYAMLLAVAVRQYVRLRHQTAVAAERERIARNLHDGLAQDLAFIAAHGQRLDTALGPEHPMMMAARRALAASRGAIVDLSASGAGSTGAALVEVASELRDRYAVAVDVAIKSDANLPAADREEVVRIAREAILNSIRHGGAKRVEVTFDGRRSEPLLRVLDDGCGIGGARAGASHGFGLPTMRARAESLGGELVTRPNPNGGTVLEVVLS